MYGPVGLVDLVAKGDLSTCRKLNLRNPVKGRLVSLLPIPGVFVERGVIKIDGAGSDSAVVSRDS